MKHPEGDAPVPGFAEPTPDSSEFQRTDQQEDAVQSESEWAPREPQASSPEWTPSSEWQEPGSFSAPAARLTEPSGDQTAVGTAFPSENGEKRAAESDSPEISDIDGAPDGDEFAQDGAQGADNSSGDADSAIETSPAVTGVPAVVGVAAVTDEGTPLTLDEGVDESEPITSEGDSDQAEAAPSESASNEDVPDANEPGEEASASELSHDAREEQSSESDVVPADPAVSEPVVSDSLVSEPLIPESVDSGPDGAETELSEPDVVEPDATAPAAPVTIDAEPVDAGPAVASAPPVNPITTVTFDDTPLARELAEITRRRQALNAQSLPLPDAPRIFTVANQKGGVGKTTTTVNLAAALARGGARVLVIDLDPQGNASTALGVEHRADTVSVYDVIINDEPMAEVVQKSPEFAGLYCVPATIHLAGAEIELVSLVAREQRLRTALDLFLSEAEEPFHYVFIDCPPSLGLLTINAFVAAREVLIPIQCEYYALEGLSQLLSNIQLIERHLNPRLTVSTILLTMYDGRTNLANQVADDVREHFPREVLNTLIPRSVRISEAPSYGQSVISYDPSSPGSLSYLEAAAEIAKRGAPA